MMENKGKKQNISRLEGNTATIRVLVGIMFILFFAGFTSALDFDNVKSYDAKTKIITITNAFDLPLISSTISNIQLKSAQNEQVGLGYQKVFEYEINSYSDYKEFIQGNEIYNLKKGNTKENKRIDLKYLAYEDIKVNDYKKECSLLKNGTSNCINIIVGSHIEQKEVWKDLTSFDLGIESKRISGWTDVKQGDYYEFIPKFAGVKVNEWATWSGNMSVNLINYYKYDANVLDSIGTNNGTSKGDTSIGGKISNARYFDGSEANITMDGTLSYSGSVSYSAWFKTNRSGTNADGDAIMQRFNDGSELEWIGLTNGNEIRFTFDGASTGQSNYITSGANIQTDTWYHLVVKGTGGQTVGYYEIWLNGVKQTLGTNTSGGNRPTSTPTYYNIGGTDQGIGTNFQGIIDEFGAWNRVISSDEVGFLYNGGDGCQYGDEGCFPAKPSVVLNSPANYLNTTNPSLTFNVTVTDFNPAGTITNVTLYVNGTVNITDTSGVNGIYLFNVSASDGYYNWSILAYDNSSKSNQSDTRFLTINTTPSVVLNSPANYLNTTNGTLIFNITNVNYGGGIKNVTFYLDGIVNETDTSGVNGTYFFNKTLSDGNHNWSILTFSNTHQKNQSATRNLTISKFINLGTSFNTLSYETASENFSSNISVRNGLTPTAASLIYNGTEYSASIVSLGGNNYTLFKYIDVSLVSGSKSFNFNFTLDGNENSTNTSTQTIGLINLTMNSTGNCNESGYGNYYNVSFADETNASVLNGILNTLTIDYYLGSGTINKTLTTSNATANAYYVFCFTPPNRTVTADIDIQYSVTGYPARVYLKDNNSFTTSPTNQTLYLLNAADGIYSTFQVTNTANQLLANVASNLTLNGVLIGAGLTGSDGSITYWLNPNSIHTLIFYLSPYDLYTATQRFTQSSYTVTLNGGTATATNSSSRGIDYSILPTNSYLVNNTSYTFGFNLTSGYWSVSQYGFNLRLANGTIIAGGTTTTSGTPLTKDYDVNNQSIIYLDYYWIINGDYYNATTSYVVQNSLYTGYSVFSLFTDLNTYISSGLFGLDDFGKSLIIYMILFLTVGVMSYKYGLSSPMALSMMVFAVIFFFDVTANLIPSILGINNLLTMLSGLVVILTVFQEFK